MLYPKENKAENTLMFACRTCPFSEEATSSCVFRNELTNTVGETAGITQDVGTDPTVGDPSECDVNAQDYRNEAYGQEEDIDMEMMMPAMCTMCGQEIVCGYCGVPCDGEFYLEVGDHNVQMGEAHSKAGADLQVV
jgi:DNA-directed RNA polymerase II subunit RPB9